MLGEVSGFDFGAILLFENERFSSKLELDDERNLRASFYSGSIYKLNLNSEFSFRAYYQPLLNSFEDYRYSLNSSLKSLITESFSVSYTISMSHDSKPLPDIEEFDRVSSVSFSWVF